MGATGGRLAATSDQSTLNAFAGSSAEPVRTVLLQDGQRQTQGLPGPPRTVVFFPGDTQDVDAEAMQLAGNGEWAEMYNLPSTLERLVAKHGASRGVACCAAELVDGTFAKYSNFCSKCDSECNVESYDGEGCIATRLLVSLLDEVLAGDHDGGRGWDLDELILVGFSRGAVVLNQLVTELAAVSKDEDSEWLSVERLWSRVRVLHSVDGANGDDSNWPAFPYEEDAPRIARRWRRFAGAGGKRRAERLAWGVHATDYTSDHHEEMAGFARAFADACSNMLFVLRYAGSDLEAHFHCLDTYQVSLRGRQRRPSASLKFSATLRVAQALQYCRPRSPSSAANRGTADLHAKK
eukprot:CAMPEP_0175216696 /NCGR_PEP_ID=MMETSP0093-20121207/17861_1 /TAXON_ID=311494 /ORGANISM="Alexandrium monilatum, Strain CCMP3105" /LENGTH=350 /DNA_ID=CAMNT_0016510099 /DNA_START=75 /DNA_END=1124 /DNA_ORIENTATION=+